jgi:hypothetical protein
VEIKMSESWIKSWWKSVGMGLLTAACVMLITLAFISTIWGLIILLGIPVN